ncbi:MULTISPECIES: class F sortase [unclassified Microbacterium]|uniref:class F sortase n=1 Tax=unclassified Microbacterium TaxID=2609290 RepID=UPI0012FA1EA4|nr:class F sortase [Microbacterium sp. MAH-37]MVQ41366.1 class F sortase [Microbacterium sp. MAH-37]
MSTRIRRSVLWLAVIVLASAALAIFIALATSSAPASGTGPVVKDMKGNSVVLDDGELTPAAEKAMDAVPDAGGRLIAESVGLDVPLGEMNEVDGVITPPGFTSAYLVRNRGVAPADVANGTTYAVTHSLRNGGVAPGNYLFDVDSGKPTIAIGATIEVDGTSFVVDKAYTVSKKALPAQTDLWADTPNRLVLITCLQNPANSPSSENVVIEAHLEVGK